MVWNEKIKNLIHDLNRNVDIKIEKRGGILENLNLAFNLIQQKNKKQKENNHKKRWGNHVIQLVKNLSNSVNLKIEKEGGIVSKLESLNNFVEKENKKLKNCWGIRVKQLVNKLGKNVNVNVKKNGVLSCLKNVNGMLDSSVKLNWGVSVKHEVGKIVKKTNSLYQINFESRILDVQIESLQIEIARYENFAKQITKWLKLKKNGSDGILMFREGVIQVANTLFFVCFINLFFTF